ncbi:hypothetical protein GCM10010912_69630 [Paenibacillus albidus]|uniref:Uncharacterized protein n=1 Tax=Paenibacillus albidus TaxID=2041023 RepID=A0A917LE65_9BACL|nr:hypothetical protein GCM10010912_69630 [Paenibacillus albidus]
MYKKSNMDGIKEAATAVSFFLCLKKGGSPDDKKGNDSRRLRYALQWACDC